MGKHKVRRQSEVSGLVVWHYTTGMAFEAIMRTGFILPSEPIDDDPPAVWFSSNQEYEPTACGLGTDPDAPVVREWFDAQGNHLWSELEDVRLSKDELTRRNGGLYRLGIWASVPGLVPWRTFCRQHSIQRISVVSMEHLGRHLGSDSSWWYAVAGRVPVRDIVRVELWSDGKWMPVRRQDRADTSSQAAA